MNVELTKARKEYLLKRLDIDKMQAIAVNNTTVKVWGGGISAQQYIEKQLATNSPVARSLRILEKAGLRPGDLVVSVGPRFSLELQTSAVLLGAKVEAFVPVYEGAEIDSFLEDNL